MEDTGVGSAGGTWGVSYVVDGCNVYIVATEHGRYGSCVRQNQTCGVITIWNVGDTLHRL